ncbi:lysozyme inhibitor LprI family protein [Agrobacterium deltaense]|uniref:lysozyme inhibitor LprI family protein n=1 Tax=Agrobacterium deltaense TaxID=1183412 RepID=UPI003D95FF40
MRHRIVCIALALSCSWILVPASAGDLEGRIAEIQAKLSMGLPKERQKQFSNAQRVWEEFRDRECRYRQTSFPLMTSRSECERVLDTERLFALQMQLDWLRAVAGPIDPVPGSCVTTAGRRVAEQLRRQCLSVTGNRRSDCRPDNSCEQIKRAIRRGCASYEAGATAFCNENR